MNARRGRPPAYDRGIALKAIVETFRLHGYAATSLDDIAKATGMNRPSLFAAFGNKKAMYLLALNTYRADMQDAVAVALDGPGMLPDVMVSFFDAAIGFYCEGAAPGCLVLCTATTDAPADEDIRSVLASVLAGIEKQIEQRIRLAVLEGKTQVDAAILAKLLSAVLISIAIQARAGASQSELKAFANSVTCEVFPGASRSR